MTSSSKVVDDGCSSVGSELAGRVGGILGHLPGCVGVDDLGSVVVDVFGRHGGPDVDVGAFKSGIVAEANQLLDVGATASTKSVDSKGGVGIDI